MDNLTEIVSQITVILTAIASMIVGVVSFVKTLKSEKRVTADAAATKATVNQEVQAMKEDIKVTRAGIVQGFKDAVVTKDVKVSINNLVKKILDEKFQTIIDTIKKNEEKRTKIAYWNLKILANTAAYDKLTVEQQSELTEDLAMIAEDEQIVETD